MRLIRWVGHPSWLDDRAIRTAIERETMPLPLIAAFQRYDKRRISASIGHSEFSVGPAHGFSQTYVWGPWLFDVQMEDADWNRLQRNALDRVMFLDITDGEPLAPRVLTKAQWRELIEAVDAEREAGQRPKVLIAVS